jgi:hypothetical protein
MRKDAVTGFGTGAEACGEAIADAGAVCVAAETVEVQILTDVNKNATRMRFIRFFLLRNFPLSADS